MGLRSLCTCWRQCWCLWLTMHCCCEFKETKWQNILMEVLRPYSHLKKKIILSFFVSLCSTLNNLIEQFLGRKSKWQSCRWLGADRAKPVFFISAFYFVANSHNWYKLIFDNSTAMYKNLEPYTLAWIRTRDLLFWRRTRWPPCRRHYCHLLQPRPVNIAMSVMIQS
jgi:hypothetical protein